MKKIFMAALAVATIALVGCKGTQKTDYLKNLNGYWLYENAETNPSKVALEVADNAVVLTAVSEGEEDIQKGTLTYDASTGKGTIVCEGQPADATVEVAAIDGDKKNINLTVKNGAEVVFDGKLTKSVKPEDPGQGGTPDLDKPAEGMVRFAIQIPEGSECNGIAFKGTFNNTDWSGEDTYCNAEQNAQVGPDECVKFTAIEGYDNWYQADYKLGATPFGDNSDIYMAGKICLIYKGDGGWQGQAIDWNYDMKYTSAAVTTSDDGNIQVNGSGLVYVTIGGWQTSECAAAETYKVTVKTPTCGDYDLEIIGSFDNWTGTAMTPNADRTEWTVTIETQPNAEYKFRQAGTWDNEIQELDAESGEWKGLANQKLGAEKDVKFDFSDASKYRWTLCE